MLTSPKLSYLKGDNSVPLIKSSLGEFLDQAKKAHGPKTAVISVVQNQRLSYDELHALVIQASKALCALGIASGDRVGIWSTNRTEWIVVQFAAARIGAILVHINPAYQENELEFTVSHSGCKILFLTRKFRTHDCLHFALNVQSRQSSLKTIVDFDTPDTTRGAVDSLQTSAFSSLRSWTSFLAQSTNFKDSELQTVTNSVDSSLAASIQYTSGTTGQPKGATLSQSNMLNNAVQIGARLGLVESDVLCLPVPMFHCFGSVVGVMAAFAHGSSVVFTGLSFDAQECIDAVHRHGCTIFYGVPMMFISVLNHPNFDSEKMKTLRTGIMGAAPCPSEVFKAAIEKMHMVGLCSSYGMTETSPMSTQCLPNQTIEQRSNTVGMVHPHVEIKIIDPVDGSIVPTGQPGELCVRGYSVMLGYWNNPQATHKAIDQEGWMHSGDLAQIREDGCVCIVGRIKDMVIRAGENIYPREIEEFLHKLPEIADAQVFGVPDALYGEQVAAWIKLKPGQSMDAEKLRALCKGQIASFKIPHYIKFVEDFPSTTSGKVQKFKMREMVISEFKLA